ncbi:MAG: ATP-binding cassette domain-containing protein, partial [Pseudomonadota bacterium]
APTSGKVTARRGLRMGYVPQKLAMDSTLPITARRFLNLPKRVDDKKAARALERTGASALSERQLNDLSGGQLQRVLLARALTGEPELLLLDEPTQGLDQPGSADFYELIEDVRRDLGCGVLMVSHELHVVMAASDRVICLNGHVCCQGTPEHVASAPEYRALFGSGTKGALALYRHQHDHHHHDHEHS